MPGLCRLGKGDERRNGSMMIGFRARSSVGLFCFFVCLMVMFCRPADTPAASLDCERARDLFAQSACIGDHGSEKDLLEEAVRLCPSHALSWNNLGALQEEDSLLDEAYSAYGESAKADTTLAAPHAGLGDVAMRMGRFKDAATHYETFLSLLSAEILRGDPYGIKEHEPEYREKLAIAREKWQIHEDSMDEVVVEPVITRGFSLVTKAEKEKPFSKPVGPERLTLAVLFAFDSDDIAQMGRRQIEEIAKSMMGDDFRESRFLIEGHTDTIGEADYNMALSRRRAESVRSFLAGCGIEPSRLRVTYYGMSRPLIPSGSRQEQAPNRRVEFVKLAD
jgi:outer membrane protein OmpA-like peptidoglycan-associated protein